MHNPRKRKLSPKKSQDLTFTKVKHGKGVCTSKKATVPVFQVKSVNVELFKSKLIGMESNVGWLKNFEMKTESVLVPKLNEIKFQLRDTVDISEHKELFESHFKGLSVSEEDCLKIECLTRSQIYSDSWTVAREERLTASNFGKVCKLKDTTRPESTLKEVLSYRSFETHHTKYGLLNEDTARRKYVSVMKKEHPSITVKNCGLLVTPDYSHLGASPDGYVNCTHCEDHNGLIEIKCPSSSHWRTKTPEECAMDKKFFCCLVNGKVRLKRNHSYFYQVQGQLAISGRKWCDFVVWT